MARNAVTSPGEVDGDGLDVLAVGTPTGSTGGSDVGKVILALGPATGTTTSTNARGA